MLCKDLRALCNARTKCTRLVLGGGGGGGGGGGWGALTGRQIVANTTVCGVQRGGEARACGRGAVGGGGGGGGGRERGGGLEMEDVHGHSKGSFDATQGYFHWQVFDKMTTVIYVCAIPQVCVLYLLSEAKIWLQKFRKDFSLTQNIWHQSLCLELKRKSKQKKWFSKWRLVYISKLCF